MYWQWTATGWSIGAGRRTQLMLFNTNKTSGRSVSERNGTSFTFTCIQDEPTSYIENMEEI